MPLKYFREQWQHRNWSIIISVTLLSALWSGVTFASFHTVGNMPLEMHVLITLVSDGAMAGAAIFSGRALKPSAPVALPDGMASISWRVCRTVMSGNTSFASELLCFSTKAVTDE